MNYIIRDAGYDDLVVSIGIIRSPLVAFIGVTGTV